MKKTLTVACMVATIIVFAATMLTGCTEKNSVESTLDELRSHPVVDTLPVHDTTVVTHDSIVHDTVTEIREVVVTRTDTVTIPGESHEYTLRLRQWHNRWLGVSGGYLIGEDSVVLTKYEGAQLLNTWRGTARHRGTATLSVGTAAYPVSVIGDSCWIAAMGGGVYSGTMAGHNVVMTLGAQAIQGPVVLNGYDWAPYLVAHEAVGQRVRFDADGNARGYIIDADGRAAGVVTAPYTTSTPEDTTRRLLWDTTYYEHLTTNPNGIWNTTASTLTWSCSNKRTIERHYNLAPTVEHNYFNFAIDDPFHVSVSGSAVAAMLGMTVPITGNVATFTSGSNTLTLTFTDLARICVLSPIPLPCKVTLTTATLASNGSGGYKVVVHGTMEGTSLNGDVPVPSVSRHETYRDTSWNGCGHLVSSSLTSVMIQHTLARTGVETVYYNIAPLTETHTVSESTMYYSQYTVSGSALTSAQGTTASFSGNTVTIGGVTLTITPGAQPWCVLTYTTATLTSNGLVVTFTYNGSTGSVTIPVTWQTPPITGKRIIAGWVSYAYQTNTSSPEEWGVLYTEDIATGQRYFEYIPWHTGTVTYSEVTNTVTISSSDTNAIRTQINQGRYGARVYNHNSTSHQWLPGMTHSSQNGSSSSTSWTVTYWFVGGTEANHVDLIVATTDINSGDSRRGVWNGTVLSADNGTLYVSNL